MGKASIGFGADIHGAKEMNLSELIGSVQPEDLIKYGLIPELVGRLPVLATLDELDESALIRILKEPKNALIKQYQRLFLMDAIELHFTDGAIKAIATESIKRKTGARGLRAIMEHTMMEIMFNLPSLEGVNECVISEDVILNNAEPILLYAKKVAVS
jgi:ATP-dependent Clp protease ATP-binding subunit ClpX